MNQKYSFQEAVKKIKSETGHLAITSSFTAFYSIADSGIVFPIFRKVLVQNSEKYALFKLVNPFHDGVPKTRVEKHSRAPMKTKRGLAAYLLHRGQIFDISGLK